MTFLHRFRSPTSTHFAQLRPASPSFARPPRRFARQELGGTTHGAAHGTAHGAGQRHDSFFARVRRSLSRSLSSSEERNAEYKQVSLSEDQAEEVAASAMPRTVRRGLLSRFPSRRRHGGDGNEWAAVADLDLFFLRVYDYYRENGLTCIIASRVANLVTLGSTIALSTYIFLFFDWEQITQCHSPETCKNLEDYITYQALDIHKPRSYGEYLVR